MIFAVGIAMLLSALFVRFRDLQPIWEVILQILFYATPVLYTVETILSANGLPEWLKNLILMNPLACIFEQFRHWVIDPQPRRRRSCSARAGSSSCRSRSSWACSGIGFWVFNREAPRIAEMLWAAVLKSGPRRRCSRRRWLR